MGRSPMQRNFPFWTAAKFPESELELDYRYGMRLG
jgi:hypothetical protein